MADLTDLSSRAPIPIVPQRADRRFSWNGAASYTSNWRYSGSQTPSSPSSSTATSPSPSRTQTPVNGNQRLPHSAPVTPSTSFASPRKREKETRVRGLADIEDLEEEEGSDDDDVNRTPTPGEPRWGRRISSPSPDRMVASDWQRQRPMTDTRRPRHRPTRSRSAPPGPTEHHFPSSSSDSNSSANSAPDRGATAARHRKKRSVSTWNTPTSRTRTWGFGYAPHSTANLISHPSASSLTLSIPAPPLHRPTTFWRHTPRSPYSHASSSSFSQVVRRSTFIAAGLKFDKPDCDWSAAGVEMRVRMRTRGAGHWGGWGAGWLAAGGGGAGVRTDFWEVA